ncbi:MAG: T9SS type A sorting domain-containing protein [Saprospiraceae bacterium]|nr:T9SS type A sorting domain-containing protein [Saprospiraceae bacterium]
MENLPAGLYDVQIFYTSANGYNEKVEGNYLFEYEKQFNHVITSAFTITENTTFDSPIYVPRDIVVNSPATLTVKDFAYFADNTKLIVKPGASLVVEGLGHLTACDNRWDGVIAEGNAKIIVNNNGSISFAKTGIFAKGDGASTITLSRAHFINSTVGLHALKRAIPVVELSYFTEGQTGVLLDNVTGGTAPNGVYFRGNEFAFMSREGILSYNTPIQVEDGNEFSYCYDGIALRNLFASNEQSLVGIQAAVNNEEYNYFENNQNAVYTNGSDVNIDNNIFTNNVFGGFYSGFSSIETERNNFSGTNGERYAGTGSNTSYSQFNEYQTGTGITAQYDNTKYTFLSNCFQTGAWDVLAIGGNIALAQGNNSVAASNCFTGSSVPDFACGTPDKVLYFTPDPMVAHPVCLDPVFVSNYEVKDNSFDHNSGVCGTSFLPPSPGEYSYIRSLGCNLTLLNNHINSLRSQINAILNQPQPLSDLDKANLSWLSRHLRYAQQRLARCLRRQGLKQELYTFYKAQNERDFDIAAAGVLFDLGYVSDALLSLDTAWNTHGGDSLVLQGLKLNLLYRDSLNRSPLNSTDIFTLKTVAAKSDPYAGYARALLYKITGERIEPDTTIVIPRTRKTTDNNLSEKYLTSPNPAQDLISINIENHSEDVEYTFKMYDIMGNMVKSGALKERSEIPVLELSEGMYFIQIHKNNTQQKTLRTIILH